MVTYQDYYQTLEVQRSATQEEIQKSFRKLARKYHPDVNKEKGAEDKFKLLNEAYEVLKDPEKRKRYDALGANWQSGQDFQAPPEWGDIFGQFAGRTGGSSQGFEGAGGFSDFFEAIFGSNMGGEYGSSSNAGFSRAARPRRGADIRGEVEVSIMEALAGVEKQILLEGPFDGSGLNQRKTLKVKIPKGTRPASIIRLAGQGQKGSTNEQSGDLLLTVKVKAEEGYKIEGDNVLYQLPLAVWEAALGSKVKVNTAEGQVLLNIPAASSSGQRLRIPGRGLFSKTGKRGDFIVELKLVLPNNISVEEQELFKKISESSNFRARN